MLNHYLANIELTVALRKESVDRNGADDAEMPAIRKSLSARRAWIEIVMQEIAQQRKQVALRKESVDRNHFRRLHQQVVNGRSPQGERG